MTGRTDPKREKGIGSAGTRPRAQSDRGSGVTIQVKVLENDQLYIRVELPGVPDDAVRHRVDAVRQKVVFFSSETVDDGNKKGPVREYSGSAGLSCDCCEITNVDAKMKDGMLRMIVSRVKVKDHETKCTLTFPPFAGSNSIIKTLNSSLCIFEFLLTQESKRWRTIANGGLYFSVDVPGVCVDDIEVLANESELRFHAEIKNVYEHDESGL
ncbi:unnamed protein product [Arabis nemorensis]|uniref:SHSP domain-containing protein n=1 Tax=Arabis nemorensis TaxID=586526 RepID=A0A565C3Y3_9BRAS|nr:unnamed protein product [Arabis nemorensis]